MKKSIIKYISNILFKIDAFLICLCVFLDGVLHNGVYTRAICLTLSILGMAIFLYLVVATVYKFVIYLLTQKKKKEKTSEKEQLIIEIEIESKHEPTVIQFKGTSMVSLISYAYRWADKFGFNIVGMRLINQG